MPTELLSLGPVSSLVQNQVYALPAVKCKLFTTGAPTLQKANDVAMTAPVAVVLVDGEAELSSGFLRCTSAGPQLVTLKRA
jgi:hypothetical protein